MRIRLLSKCRFFWIIKARKLITVRDLKSLLTLELAFLD